MRERIWCYSAGVNDFIVTWSCSTSCYGLFAIVQRSRDTAASYLTTYSKLVIVQKSAIVDFLNIKMLAKKPFNDMTHLEIMYLPGI